MVATDAEETGIFESMGRGTGDQASGLLYGELSPFRSRLQAARATSSLSIPVSPHVDFRPNFRRLGLESYVPDPAVENGGYSGGKWWQAMGDVPKSWVDFKSARMINLAEQQILAGRRRAAQEAYAAGDTLLCELGDVYRTGRGTYRRKVLFGTEDSRSSVDADHFEAMSRVILSEGGDIHETRFLSDPRSVACFDENGGLVGLCVALVNP